MKRFLIPFFTFLLVFSLLFSTCFVGTAQGDQSSPSTREELLTPLQNDYRSRTETTYSGINGKDVTLYGFFRESGEVGNNPNFSQALMIAQCIKYKDANPEEEVYISFQSFHISVVFAACVDPTKPDYGHVKSLYDCDYNADGYVRLSYLLVEAAKKGIHVCVVGQTDANPTAQDSSSPFVPDHSFVEYFQTALTAPSYISGKTVGDYLTFGNCRWLSYGDKSAADMMHNKTCTVSNYIDNNGVEHGAAIWTGSINLDGINYLEQNGHDSVQSAVLITEHEAMRQVLYNYAMLVADYCQQEDIVPFRVEVIKRTNEQVQLLLSGKGNEIAKEEQIIYLGSETDPVFELYFTPLGGAFSTWDTTYNPYAKYMSAMLAAADSKDYIEFIWNNVKFNQNFELADSIVEVIVQAFTINSNTNSKLHLTLPGLGGDAFNGLIAGENIGHKSVNNHPLNYHIKDLQLSYVENGARQYITIINSLNYHEGASYHQTNTILVIKESDRVGNNFYVEYATITTPSLNLLSERVQKSN